MEAGLQQTPSADRIHIAFFVQKKCWKIQLSECHYQSNYVDCIGNSRNNH